MAVDSIPQKLQDFITLVETKTKKCKEQFKPIFISTSFILTCLIMVVLNHTFDLPPWAFIIIGVVSLSILEYAATDHKKIESIKGDLKHLKEIKESLYVLKIGYADDRDFDAKFDDIKEYYLKHFGVGVNSV